MKITVIFFTALWTLGSISIPHPLSVQFKLNQMCYLNPDLPCKEVIDYCKQSIERGHECIIIK